MAKKPSQKPSQARKMDGSQPANKDRSNNADRSGTDRRRTGEGSASALANLKNIERDRQRSRPDDDSSGR
jgi:hypothetical protein